MIFFPNEMQRGKKYTFIFSNGFLKESNYQTWNNIQRENCIKSVLSYSVWMCIGREMAFGGSRGDLSVQSNRSFQQSKAMWWFMIRDGHACNIMSSVLRQGWEGMHGLRWFVVFTCSLTSFLRCPVLFNCQTSHSVIMHRYTYKTHNRKQTLTYIHTCIHSYRHAHDIHARTFAQTDSEFLRRYIWNFGTDKHNFITIYYTEEIIWSIPTQTMKEIAGLEYRNAKNVQARSLCSLAYTDCSQQITIGFSVSIAFEIVK